MKTSKFFVTAVLSGMLFISSVNATDGNKPVSASSNSKNMLRAQIVKALSNVSATDQEVFIRFSVSSEKGFELLKVDGKNTELVKTVKFELGNENILVPTDLEGVYSLKVRFSDREALGTEDAASVLRNQIANALTDVMVNESASVKLELFINNNSLKVKKVEGSNKALVTFVESVLSNSAIVPPAELAGNYQITVKF